MEMRAGANNTGGKERSGYIGYARRRKRRWSVCLMTVESGAGEGGNVPKKKIGKDIVG